MDGGGASGGGSVNIFYREIITRGNITARGGTGGTVNPELSTAIGGAGGSGSITVGSIATGTFVKNE